MRYIAILVLASAFALHTGPMFSAVVAAQGQEALGAVTGTAQSSTGQPLANFTVQLRDVVTGQLVGSTTSNVAGVVSFAGLNPATYVMEVVNAAGQIVGTSAAVTVTAGATVSITVTASAAAALTAGAAGGAAAAAAGGGAAAGVGSALVITTVAAIGGIVGFVVDEVQDGVRQEDASASR